MEWLDPWWHVAAERPDLATAYEWELRAEVGVGHPLFGVAVAALGKRDGSDDVLFRVLDGSERLAVVHLTWPDAPSRHLGRRPSSSPGGNHLPNCVCARTTKRSDFGWAIRMDEIAQSTACNRQLLDSGKRLRTMSAFRSALG